MNVGTSIITTTAATKRRPGLLRILRPMISAALLLYFFGSIGFDRFREILANSSASWLVVGLLVVVTALVISAYKWQRLLVAQGVRVPLARLFCSYLVGLFFNNFLPTNIGGDVVRIADVGRYSGRMPEATASVVGERILAGFALGLIAIFGMAFSYQVSSGFAGAVAGIVVFFGLMIGVLASPQAKRVLGARAILPDWFSLRSRVEGIARSMGKCFDNKGVLAWVVVLSLAFHTTVILVNYFIFLALGVEVSLFHCFLVVPIIMALQMLPISLNGFGVREGAYVYFFGWAGINAATAIAASLLFWALVTAVSLIGGLVFALRK